MMTNEREMPGCWPTGNCRPAGQRRLHILSESLCAGSIKLMNETAHRQHALTLPPGHSQAPAGVLYAKEAAHLSLYNMFVRSPAQSVSGSAALQCLSAS